MPGPGLYGSRLLRLQVSHSGALEVTMAVLTPARTAVLRRRIRIVVAITIGWNVVEAVVALVAGGIASSAALIGFGLDSVAEVLSAGVVAWQFAVPDPERREKVALRVIAWSFFALAAYVSVDAILSLAGLREPEPSAAGMVLAADSLLGWTLADSIAALVIAGLAVREGAEAWRGDTCCAAPVTVLTRVREPGTGGDECCPTRTPAGSRIGPDKS